MKDKKGWIRSLFNQKPTTVKQTNSLPEAAPHSPEEAPIKESPVPPGVVVLRKQDSSGGPQSWNAADGVPAVWNVGDLIIGEFEVISKLGEGGMGAVYKIHNRQLHADLVVKSPRPEIFTRADGKENFIREAETWVKLRRHPHLVQCFFVHTLGRIPRIFAEYVDGGSLADWIRGRKLYEGGENVALARMLDVAIQFAWGLHAAHEQGLVHQDIKPANIMLTSQGVAKVTDFGLAKARALAGEATLEKPAGEQSLLVSGGWMTPAYCSPEQAARQPLSRKTDIWSWGLSVLEMFVGEVTWMVGVAAREALASHVREDPAIPAMPPEVVKLLNRCFDLQPEKRPETMLEVATELQAIYVQRVGRAYPRKNPQLADLDADTLMVQGIALDRLGKPQEALALYEQAIRLDPDHFAAHHNKGLALLQLGSHEEALAAYEQAIRLYEANASKGKGLMQHADFSLTTTYDQKGIVLRRLGRLEEALAAYEQAIRLDPTYDMAHNNKGNVLLDLGRREEALNAYEQAIHLDPTNASAHNNKGNVLLQLGKPQEALASLEQAIRLDPKLTQAHANKRRALLQLKKHEEANTSSEQTVQPSPLPAHTYETLGFGLLQRGEPQAALNLLEQAIRLDSTLANAHYYKGLALLQLRRLEEALTPLEQAIGLNPKLADAYHCKGAALSELGRQEEALTAYERAIHLDPRLALTHFHKGLVLKQLGRREEALAAFEQAMDLDPTFVKYWRMML